MKKIILSIFVFILLLNFSSAVVSNWSDSFSNTGAWSNEGGMRIYINHTSNFILENITVGASTTFGTLSLKDSTKTITLNSTTTKINNNFTMTYLLEAGETYWIIGSSEGNHQYSGAGTPSFPKTSNNITWNRGLNPTNGAEDTSNSGYDILKIYYHASTTPTSINIDLDTPIENSLITDIGANFTVNYTVTSYNLTNATYYVWKGNTIFNNSVTVNLNGTSNSTNRFIDDFSIGNYKWNVLTCARNSTDTECKFADTNYTFQVGASINNVSYNQYVYETAREKYSAYITVIPGTIVYDVQLVYDGLLSTGTFTELGGNSIVLNASRDVPLITTNPQNKSFYFRIIYSDGVDSFLYQNSSSWNQSISQILLSECSYAGNVSYNFTSRSETNQTLLNPFNFLATFSYWIGEGSTYKNLSINALSTSGKKVCMDNITQPYKTNAIIQYEKDGFYKRNYYLINSTVTNNTQEIGLYSLTNDEATSFIVDVREQSYIPVEDAYLYIQRYYPGTNEFKTVAMSQTDADGRTVSAFESETEDYRIIVFKNGQVLYTSPVQKIYCQATPCTLNIQVTGEGVSSWNPVGNLSNLVYDLTFNYTSKIFTFTYVDTSGTTSYARLHTYKLNPGSGRQTICDTNSTENANVLTCNVTGYNGTIMSEIFISRSPETFINNLEITLNNIINNVGFEGLWWAMLILMVLAIAGVLIGGITGGILLTILGVIIVPLFGLAQIGSVFIWGIVVMGIFILWIINR